MRFLILLMTLVGMGELGAKCFEIPEVGVALTTPEEESWAVDKEGGFGTVLRREGSQGKLRVHLSRKASSPAEALELSVQALKEKAAEGQPAVYVLLSEKSVMTAGGLRGVVGRFGSRSKKGEWVAVARYYFLREDGRSFCVCAYMMGEEGEGERYEAIILNTLRFLPGNAS